eukprot:CAMPEP_0201483412 /NCGR_PEP_ID=MMETSP0151_2-20130828/7627_1 /ASSEMBLY_ACC=CAM_ASM_000257 /TAXON_ID=200890 /ORGANISM="Paramoeba atlantica, Strain 621/1 / CCAP 1560/9" /LENGTH=62 /DNA_ID=CAMNT_0047866549 /DNA_START=116 /DNA_END=302 /DNA_ORIENTATION=+
MSGYGERQGLHNSLIGAVGGGRAHGDGSRPLRGKALWGRGQGDVLKGAARGRTQRNSLSCAK